MSSEIYEIFKCPKCGAMVHVVQGGAGELACCDVPMDKVAENSTDAAQEKHVPVVEKTEGGIRVTVGSVNHPMEADHSIEWIEVIAAGGSWRAYLKPGDAPEAFFPVDGEPENVRAYCNLHGLWKAK
jgi:superoxide reductase